MVFISYYEEKPNVDNLKHPDGSFERLVAYKEGKYAVFYNPISKPANPSYDEKVDGTDSIYDIVEEREWCYLGPSELPISAVNPKDILDEMNKNVPNERLPELDI